MHKNMHKLQGKIIQKYFHLLLKFLQTITEETYKGEKGKD